MTRCIISAKFLHFLLVGTPLCAPACTMRVGLTIEKWLFLSRFPATADNIERLSFILARVKTPRTRLPLTFEGSIHFIHAYNAPSAEQA